MLWIQNILLHPMKQKPEGMRSGSAGPWYAPVQVDHQERLCLSVKAAKPVPGFTHILDKNFILPLISPPKIL